MSTVPSPATATEALGMLRAALGFLTAADATQMVIEEQAQCLQALERFNSMSTAARASYVTWVGAVRGRDPDAATPAREVPREFPRREAESGRAAVGYHRASQGGGLTGTGRATSPVGYGRNGTAPSAIADTAGAG